MDRDTTATDGPFTFRLDAKTRNQLRRVARRFKISQGALARRALEDRLTLWETKGLVVGNGH